MNYSLLLIPIIVPFTAGIITLLIPKKIKYIRELLAILALAIVSGYSVKFLVDTSVLGSISLSLNLLNIGFSLLGTPLSSFLLIAGMFLSLLVALFSIKAAQNAGQTRQYWAYFLWTATALTITLLTDNLIALLVVWGAIAVLFYLLILLGKPGAEKAGYKALIMIGGSDVLMLIGAGIIFYLSGTLTLSAIKIPLDSPLSYIAFILLMIGIFTKLGVMPFHTWLPDSAEFAPVSVLALFPSIIDKILGIYLLMRIAFDLFTLTPNSAMSIVLMALGSITIIISAGMALVQNNLYKLLAYSTISQAGYLVLGIGVATPLGVIGGLFHMLNNIIYKTQLFFSAGAVENQTKETDLDKLGGLSRFMPITFITTIISVFAISGIPPFNGFVSKWLIYQSLLQTINPASGQGWFIVIFIICAMLGSVLTLAYFLKMLYSVFWGNKPKTLPVAKEASWLITLPMILLAGVSILFGVFAQFPLQYFIAPILGINISQGIQPIAPYGFWSPQLSTLLILLGIIIGIIIYLFTRTRQVKSGKVFIGGEEISPQITPTAVDEAQVTVSGATFYDTVKEIKLVSEAYRVADSKFFDIFEQLRKFIGLLVKVARKIHNGLLQTYLGWLLLGIIAIIVTFLIILLR
ncbi:MAG: proton-conducting transporter membrane subunit [candidate division WOR-3 bacterium]